MTLNLKSLAFVPYVSLFSGICIDVLATFDHFERRLIRAAGKKRELVWPAKANLPFPPVAVRLRIRLYTAVGNEKNLFPSTDRRTRAHAASSSVVHSQC